MSGRFPFGYFHQRIHELELLERFPAAILLAPLFWSHRQPDRKTFGEILIRMRLGIPIRKMPYKALTIGAGTIRLRRVLRLVDGPVAHLLLRFVHRLILDGAGDARGGALVRGDAAAREVARPAVAGEGRLGYSSESANGE